MNIYLHTIKVLDSRNWTAEQPKHVFVQNTLRDGGLDALNKWASDIMHTVTYDGELGTLEVDHAGHSNTFYVKLAVTQCIPVSLKNPMVNVIHDDWGEYFDKIIKEHEVSQEPSFTNRLTSLRYKALSVIEAFMKSINEFYCDAIMVNEVIIFRQTNNLSLYKISKLDNDSIIVEFSGKNTLALSSLTTENVCQIADYLQTVKQKRSCAEN